MLWRNKKDAKLWCKMKYDNLTTDVVHLSTRAICRIVGSEFPVALNSTDMAKSLRIAFYPPFRYSRRLEDFLGKLKLALEASGVKIVSYEEALARGCGGKIEEGVVLFAPGEGEAGNLAIDHVASLSKNTVVGVLDGTMPGSWQSPLQRRLDSLITSLVWHMAQVVIYVDDLSWTIGNMNGSMDTFSLASLNDRVRDSLIPKLAAPVIPPSEDNFEIREGEFDSAAPELTGHLTDLVCGANAWRKTGLLVSQTKINDLAFRNGKYRKIAAAFLNWRTGMSYGFLARQLPVNFGPAKKLCEAPDNVRQLNWEEKDFYEVDDQLCIGPIFCHQRFVLGIPDVSVLCTRSGCEKTELNPSKDVLMLSLHDGRMIVRTPRGSSGDCQPSFDSTTILAHAIGNVIVACIDQALNPCSVFGHLLQDRGLALAHWHGFLPHSNLPRGYFVHGEFNPPVSCSTPQAAIFALSGKLSSFGFSFEENISYLGDMHVEPSHGSNITGRSLVELASIASGVPDLVY
jgi:hypothetical protein